MHEPTFLASLLRRTVHGPMWHGPSLREALDGVSAADAARHPMAGAHSVWELVLHVAAWAEIAAQRLAGDARTTVRDDEDFPPVSAEGGDEAWAAAIARMERAYEALAVAAQGLEPARLAQPVTGHEYSAWTMLHGVVEHGTYHAGQVVLLKRAAVARQ